MNATDTDVADLEGRLREALRRRAASTPIPVLSDEVVDREFARMLPRRPPRRLVVVIGGVAAALLLALVALAFEEDGEHDLRTSDEPPTLPITPGIPRLLLPVVPLTLSSEGMNPLPRAEDVVPVQAFRQPGRWDGPSIWLQTAAPKDNFGFGVVGTAVEVRQGPAFLARTVPDGAPGGGSVVSVALPDGGYLWAIGVGVSDDALVAFVDSLEPLGDGRWTATSVPDGLVEVTGRDAPDGSYYSANSGPDHRIDISLYGGTFESWLSDRVSSSAVPVELVIVAGERAVRGAYGERDHWVILEPEPGRTLELRFSDHSRTEVDALLAGARFVDEATWDAATG